MNPVQPLKDYQVLITRGKGQADGLKESIEKMAERRFLFHCLSSPFLIIWKMCISGLKSCVTYDWIILTSQNGVDFFFRLLGNQPLKLPKIAVIGSKTEAALKRHGYKADFVPARFVAEGFVAEFNTLLDQGARVLLAKGNLARAVIAEAINEAGAICDEVIIYHTVLPRSSEKKLVQLIKNHEIDIMTFTSSSTVNHFLQIMKSHELDTYIDRIIIACIGPIAAKTAEKHGLSVDVCPDVYTTDAMVAELIRFILKRNKQGGTFK